MSDLATRLRTACDQVRVKSYPLSDLIPLMQQAADALAAAPRQPAPSAAPEDPLQVFDSPRAKSLMRAWEEGWEACRDAEYVGEEAQNDAFNSSHTLTLCLAEDQLLPTPQADSLQSPAPEVGRVYLVATGEIHEGEETYTRHDNAPPPLCDSECLYTAPQEDSQPAPVMVNPPCKCGYLSFAEDLDFIASHARAAVDADRAARKEQTMTELADEQIEDLLECGNPTDEEKRLIRMGWDAARNARAVQAGAGPLKSFTTAQVERLYYNTHRANCDVSTLAAFRRVVALIESSHGIKGGQHAE